MPWSVLFSHGQKIATATMDKIIINRIILLAIIFCSLLASCRSQSLLTLRNSGVSLEFSDKPEGLKYNILRDGKILQSFELDASFRQASFSRKTNGLELLANNGRSIGFDVVEDSPHLTLFRITQNMTRGESAQICANLLTGYINWYGGPENRYQYWPVEKFSFSNYSYLTKETDNCAIAERYWLSSVGIFIYIEPETPLFIDQNSPGYQDKLCMTARNMEPYDTTEANFTFNYFVGIARNAREAHLAAVNRFLKKPTGLPDERMVRHPIWSTWALYKTEIDEKIVTNFSEQILKYKFNNSQLEIDDDWEVCYGALTFRTSKFSNISALTSSLKAKGFRITLWIHPFINKNCNPWYDEAKQKGYLVLDRNGNPDTQWWNSKVGESAYVDFTKPEAAKWWSDRLKKLQTIDGIDSFKFDAGETSWTPKNPVLVGNRHLNPSLITMAYVRTDAQFGPMVEVRSGQLTQDLPIFVRMIDKDSEWGWNNGLLTLITTLLQMNIAGYPFVLPDMIGGNGYNNHPPNKELFIRWLQTNVFMPSLQFSYVPWQYDAETVNISLAMTQLHADYTDLIMRRAKMATVGGDPINPPLWWAAPEDLVALQIYDQFMLGDEIIAAPVVVPGQTQRDVYLPRGRWRDGNTGAIHEGPKWVMSYPAPLSVLPYFVRVPPPSPPPKA